MINNNFYLNVINIKKKLFSGFVNKIQIIGNKGQMEILSKHAPLISTLKPGFLKLIDVNLNIKFFYISSGIVEIQPHKVIILVNKFINNKNFNK